MSVPIHREGFPFIALFAGVNLLAFLIAAWLGILLLPLTIWCIAFFRDPERTTPTAPGLIVSPADGKLLPIVEAVPPPELGLGEAPRVRLSIFMNVFNVHVNRSPIAGVLTRVQYQKGLYLNAMNPASADRNEQNIVTVRGEGFEVTFKQIAGLIARRIVFNLREGETVGRGQRVGLIKFGSRVDVIVPAEAELKVKVGDKVKGGSSVLAAVPAGAIQ